MHVFWKGTRQEFERERTWRATIRRGAKIYFILEQTAGTFYEFREGEHHFRSVGRGPVDIGELQREERAGALVVLAGKLLGSNF
jgi:hypothetical protein